MPFRSKRQWRKFALMVKRGLISKKTFEEWMAASPPYKTLPERVKKLEKKLKRAKI